MKRPAKKATKWVTCKRGHRFQKSSGRPVCPQCWPGYYTKAKTTVNKNSRASTRKPASPKTTPYTHYHKDGSLWAKGHLAKGIMEGYWEWFRKDGTKLRSGSFKHGKQVGEWITYDQRGKIYKKTLKK